MGFSPLTAAAGIWDSSSAFINGSATTNSAKLNFLLPIGTPLFVMVSWQGTATIIVSDDANNVYTQILSKSADTIANCCALFQCSSPVQNASNTPLTITATAMVSVTHLFVAPFAPFIVSSPIINNPPGVQGATFLSGTTPNPAISTTLPHTYDMVVAMVFGNAAQLNAQPGWLQVQASAGGAMLAVNAIPTAGSYNAQPVNFPNFVPAIAMIIFSMPAAIGVGLTLDNNGKYLPQGLTELRPPGDTVLSFQNAAGWGLPFVSGETVRLWWQFFQPNPPTWNPNVDFDWSITDAAMSLAAENGMFINIIFGAGDQAPAWLMNSGIPTFSSTRPAQDPFPCPWDPVYQFFLSYVISSLAARYDNNPHLANISCGGFGWQTGMAFCRSDADNATLYATSFEGIIGLNLLYQAFQNVIGIWAGFFRKTRLTAEFFSPIFPNNSTTELISVQWTQWLFQFGAQFGIEYHNYNPQQGSQDRIPEAVTFNFSGTNLSFAQPEHSSTDNWKDGILNQVALSRAALCETYIGQLQSDTLGVLGYNSQLEAVMLQYVASNWKVWTPQFPQRTFSSPIQVVSINESGVMLLLNLLNSLFSNGFRTLRDVNGNYYPIESILTSSNLYILYSMVYWDADAKRITPTTSVALPPNLSQYDHATVNDWVQATNSAVLTPPQVFDDVATYLYDVVSPV